MERITTRLGGDKLIYTISVRHPSGRGYRGVDVPACNFVDDEKLGAALGHLNHAIAKWPVEPVTVAAVRSA